MNPDSPPFTGSADRAPPRPTASIVPFRQSAGRRMRRDGDDAPRGAILLFTGVRYERMPEPDVPETLLRRRS